MKRNYNQDLDELEEVSIMEDEGSSTLPPIRLELNGISTEEELAFLKNKAVGEGGSNVVPIYIVFGLDVIYACDVDLTIELLLSLKYIGLNKYTLTLVNGDRRLDVLKPNIEESSIEMLLNFVRIGGLK